MPLRTSRTSAPTRSQMVAISLMKEILVASMQLAAYLVISALRMPMTISLSRVRAKGAYSSRMVAAALSDEVPMTTRSGFMKSEMASPSFRNSGLETTSKSKFLPRAASSSVMMARTRSAVPTGTVDLSTTMRSFSMVRPISRATCST